MKPSSERVLASLLGVGFLCALLVLVFFQVSIDRQQFFIILVIASLAAGGFAAILPGAIKVGLSAIGMRIRAVGAIGVAVLVFWIGRDFAPQDRPPPSPFASMTGFLGENYEFLISQRDRPLKVRFEPTAASQLRDFHIDPRLEGKDWADVYNKLCEKFPCLKCTPTAGSITSEVLIGVSKPLRIKEGSDSLKRKPRTC